MSRLLNLQHATEVDGGADHHQVYIRVPDGLFKLGNLLFAVAHRGQYVAGSGIFFKGLSDGADGERPRVDDLCSAVTPGGNPCGAIGHFAVSERGAIFDGEDALAANGFGLVQKERRGSLDDLGRRVQLIKRIGDG